MNASSPKTTPDAAAATTSPARPRRRRRAWLLLIPLAALAVGGSWYWQVGRFMESTDNAYVQGDIAVLGARVEGDVAEILVGDNQPVTAGQPLIRLDDSDWKARRDSAAADLRQAEAAIVILKAQIEQQQAQIAASEAQIPQAEAEQVRASADARRSSALVGGGWSSRETNDRALADSRKADAALIAARANAGAQRAMLPVLQAQVGQAEARRDSARAALALAERNLANTVIRAPFDGVAGNRAAQLGQHVSPGQNLIAVAPVQTYVVANFKETQLSRMRVGQPVYLAVDALNGTELHGRIESLSPATGAQFSLLPPENATGNFTKIVQRVPVRIAIESRAPEARDGAFNLIRPGLSVEAEVDTRADPAAPRGVWGSLTSLLGFGPAAAE
ncbi:HlyD family secretion protein [Acetobacteraceae bacterium H6797]|nr:HlyD family secretion protein [Acetobacteraceae bacterium H6797]